MEAELLNIVKKAIARSLEVPIDKVGIEDELADIAYCDSIRIYGIYTGLSHFFFLNQDDFSEVIKAEQEFTTVKTIVNYLEKCKQRPKSEACVF